MTHERVVLVKLLQISCIQLLLCLLLLAALQILALFFLFAFLRLLLRSREAWYIIDFQDQSLQLQISVDLYSREELNEALFRGGREEFHTLPVH